jgi:hypothetical protein
VALGEELLHAVPTESQSHGLERRTAACDVETAARSAVILVRFAVVDVECHNFYAVQDYPTKYPYSNAECQILEFI